MFTKESTAHCIVVPAQSTLRSSAQCGAGDILISGSGSTTVTTHYRLNLDPAIFNLHYKVQNLIAYAYTVSDSGTFSIDESKLRATCLLLDQTSTCRPSMGTGEATAASTSVPHVEPNQLTTEEVASNLESRSNPAHRPTAARATPGILDEANITNDPRQIATSPISVEDISPFIQQIANEVWEEAGRRLPTIEKIISMTMAEIQVSCDRRTATAAPATDHAVDTIRMLTPTTTGGRDDQEPPSPTVITPNTHTTAEGASTPIAGQDRAALVNREMVGEEVDHALAGAVANLARLLSGDVGRAT